MGRVFSFLIVSSLIVTFGSVSAIAASSSLAATIQSELQNLEQQRIKSANAAQPYTLLIYGDEATFSPELAGREIRFLKNHFGLPVIAFSVSSATELTQDLLELTKTKALLRHMIVRGLHGGTYEMIPSFEIQDRAHEDFSTIGFEDLEKAGVKLNFTADAYVYFDSCTMIENETAKSI